CVRSPLCLSSFLGDDDAPTRNGGSMSKLVFDCVCGKHYRADPRVAGAKILWKQCRRTIRVPMLPPTPHSSATPQAAPPQFTPLQPPPQKAPQPRTPTPTPAPSPPTTQGEPSVYYPNPQGRSKPLRWVVQHRRATLGVVALIVVLIVSRALYT